MNFAAITITTDDIANNKIPLAGETINIQEFCINIKQYTTKDQLEQAIRNQLRYPPTEGQAHMRGYLVEITGHKCKIVSEILCLKAGDTIYIADPSNITTGSTKDFALHQCALTADEIIEKAETTKLYNDIKNPKTTLYTYKATIIAVTTLQITCRIDEKI